MTRLLLLCALVGAAILYMRESHPPPVQIATDTSLEVPAAAITPAAPVSSSVDVLLESDVATAPLVPELAPRAPKTFAKRAAPIPTTQAPAALAVLELPSAGLPVRNAAAPRLPVTEILPDGTSRAAGGPTEPSPPITKQLSRRPVAGPVLESPLAKPVPESVPSAAIAVIAPTPPRPNRTDTFFKNAARILAETEIPK